jgi:hypothetical protein
MEASGQLHAPAALPPGKEPTGTYWIGGWEGPKTDLEDAEKRFASVIIIFILWAP